MTRNKTILPKLRLEVLPDGPTGICTNINVQVQIKKLERKIDRATKRLGSLQEEKDSFRIVACILHALKTSWSDRDPGKYSMSAHFLTRSASPAVAMETLPPNAEVPQRYARVSVEEILTEACPTCQKPSPVISLYWQQQDSPSGDLWIRQKILICCDAVHTLWQDEKPHRF